MLGLRARQILALAAVVFAIAFMSLVIEITTVTRRAVEDARREANFTTRTLVLQIGQVVANHPGQDPLAVIAEDPSLQVSLDAATQFAPTVLYAAFSDSAGRAVIHSDPTQVGRLLTAQAAMPELGGPIAAWRFLWRLFRGGEIHEEMTPLRIGETRFGAVRIAQSATFMRQEVLRVFHRGLYLALAYIALAMVAAVFLTRIVLGPLGEVRRGIEALRAGDFSYRIPHQNIQEFGLLAQALNELGAQFHARELTRGNEGNLRRAVELLGDGLLVIGSDREIHLINGIAAHFLGVDAAVAQGRPLASLLPAEHPVLRLVDEVLSGRRERISVRAELPGETGERAVMALGHRVHDETESLGVLIELKDLTVLRDLQAVMDHSTVLSRLGEMAAGVAHEIRNPLNAITLHLEPLRHAERLDPAQVREAVETTRQQIARLDRAVSGFLKVARLRRLTLVPLDPAGLAGEVADLLAPEATMAGLQIDLECSGTVRDVPGDPEVLRQALINVVKNALQALPSRDHRVTIAVREEDGRVAFSVRDSGPGMSEDIRRRAFDLYMTTKESGTGVGLAFVLQAVEMHGGTVTLESAPQQGTTVTLRLQGADAARLAEHAAIAARGERAR